MGCWLGLLEEFVEEFADFIFGLGEGFASGGGCPVGALGASCAFEGGGFEEAVFLHGVEHGVDGSGADFVAVALEFLHDAEAEDGFFGGVVKDMQADEPGVEPLNFDGGRRLCHGWPRVERDDWLE